MPQNTVKHIVDRPHVRGLIFLCATVYFTSYVTRINYKAVISEIVRAEGIAKTDASLALTALFITYGIGQLISGYLGDRIKPKYLMTAGLLLSSAMNILLPMKLDPVYMLVIWGINGFGQALMWPPIVKTFSVMLSPKDYTHATARMSWGSALGTMAVYLITPAVILFAPWKCVFYISAGIGLFGAALTFFGFTFMENYAEAYGAEEYEEIETLLQNTEDTSAKKQRRLPAGFALLIGFILIAITAQGALRDGLDTWMPSYISETFGLDGSLSILSVAIMPLFCIVSYEVTTYIYNRFFKNDLLCAAVLFGFASAFALILTLFAESSPVLSVLCLAMIMAFMHGINLVLICFVPRRFKKYGNISTMSGILNFATYVGSALSTYGFAALSQKYGWSGTTISWLALALLGLIVSLALVRPWKKFLSR